MIPRVTLGDLFWSFFRVSARGFGGVLPWARRMLVEERRWLTPQEFTDVFSLCQFLPGANIVNVSVVIGARFHGVRGALVAFAGLVTLPLAVALVLAALYTRFGQVPAVDAVLRGVGAAAAGLVIGTGLEMAAPLARSPRALGFLLAAFAGIALLRWPLVPVLLALAPLSVLAAWGRRA
ncbi:MAG: chromate transporter [Candidatus Rokubacteria bacterium]|nr:chromate transporter [Candidatus Rokubacteria bacterium]